jgi:hypothetical protein
VRLLIGLLRDKAARDYLLNFDHPRFQITFTTAPGHRATPPHDLAERAAFRHTAVEVCADLDAAFAQADVAQAAWVVVCGSLRMGAAAREWLGLLTPEDFAEAQATRAIFEGERYLSRLVGDGEQVIQHAADQPEDARHKDHTGDAPRDMIG